MPINIVGLTRPKQQHGEEVGPRDKSDDHGEAQGPGSLAEILRDHWILGAPSLPRHKSSDAEAPKHQGGQRMRARPCMLSIVSL